jgi:hypothetical protein
MPLFVRFLAIALLTILSPTTVQAIGESFDAQVGKFALERYRDGRRLIEGPRAELDALSQVSAQQRCFEK